MKDFIKIFVAAIGGGVVCYFCIRIWNNRSRARGGDCLSADGVSAGPAGEFPPAYDCEAAARLKADIVSGVDDAVDKNFRKWERNNALRWGIGIIVSIVLFGIGMIL